MQRIPAHGFHASLGHVALGIGSPGIGSPGIGFFVIGLLGIAVMSLAATNAYAQSEWYETYTGWTVSTDPVLPAEEVHPSIWFSSDAIAALQAKRNADAYAAGVWSDVEDEIDDFSGMSIDDTTPNTRPMMAKTLAFAWLMNEDEAALTKAVDALLRAYDNVPRNVPTDGEYRLIYRATWLQNYLAAYDWVQPELTEQEDADIRALLIEEAQLIRDNLVDGVRYAPRPHNHRSKPAWALASAALTLPAHDQAADWLEHALEQANTVTKYQFSFDGIYREGGHYHMYNMVNLIPFLWHYLNVSGVDLFEAFAPGFEWPVRIRMHRGSMPNIEDSYIKPMPTHMVAAAYREHPTDLHSLAPLSDVLQWSWMNTTVQPSNYTGATNDVVWSIDEFITYDPAIPQAEPDVNPTLHVESGQVAFRNAWSPQGDDGRYLLFHGVAAADNHNHPDHLSYFIESHGALLAVDAGYGADGFSDPLREAWYTTPEAHNVVTVNGGGTTDWDFNDGPTLHHFLATPGYDFAEMEARILFRSGNSARRGIAFPDHQYWVVYDLLYADAEADYDLNVHGRATRVNDVVNEGNRVSWTTPATWGSRASLHAYFFASDPDAEVEMETGAASLAHGHAETQYFAKMQQRADTAAFMHLLFPAEAGENAPQVTDFSSGHVLSFVVDAPDSKGLFAVQTRNEHFTIADITSDASFTWAKTPGDSLTALALTRGSEFGWMGRTLLRSDLPLTLSAGVEQASIRRLTLDEFDGEAHIELTPAAGRVYDAVTFDEGDVDFDLLEGGGILFTATSAGTYEAVTSVGAEVPDTGPSDLRFDLFPNPFGDRVQFRYAVPRSGRVTVRIFDALGRLVASPVDAVHTPGEYEIHWDSKTQSGRRAPNGLYFFEIRTGTAVSHTTAVLNR